MPQDEGSHILTVTTAVVLETWPDHLLASLNLALTFSATSLVPKVNQSYQRALDAHLIEESGKPHDRASLLDALSFVISQRLKDGTWGKADGLTPAPTGGAQS